METYNCKICRRAGVKLFLKGERCFSQKCAMIKRPYSPGQKKKRKGRSLSEYGKQLREKQKLRNWYNLEEKQFKGYVKEALTASKSGKDAEVSLVRNLEVRLDNVIFRAGFGSSRSQARQMVTHGHFLVDNKVVDVPSYPVKIGDVLKVAPVSLKKKIFENIKEKMKKAQPPSWISLDPEKLEAKIANDPNMEEAAPPADISLIFGFYSK